MKIAIGQFGGPTTVINASLQGALAASTSLSGVAHETYGVIGGASGLVRGDFVRLDPALVDAGWLLRTPGAALKSGRFRDFEASAEVALKHLKERQVDGLLVIGGNGTMALADAVERTARDTGYPLSVVGVPKTIDNDIVGIDHAPGYPTAARFVVEAVRDLTLDLAAMVGFEQVRVVEVMGRQTGWLAGAATMVGQVDAEPVICLAERTLDMDTLLATIAETVDERGSAVVVVSEGVKDESGHELMQAGAPGAGSTGGILGGIGSTIAGSVRHELGFGTRYENLGLLQRCFAQTQLALDRDEAFTLGQAGAEALLRGESGLMVGLTRQGKGNASGNAFTPDWLAPTAACEAYGTEIVSLPLAQVAGKTRFMTEDEQRLDEQFIEWLAPLIDFRTLHKHPHL